ncbi:MAG TPA: Smr/MutS family protein, partial [Flavobacteriaceae bacterium]|nr:Smr/MutS family protein [Flavobacteriaceae bacterium]
ELMKKNISKPKKKSIFKTDDKNKSMPFMEVDLHIEKLIKNTSKIDKIDALEIQLDTAKLKLDFAVRNRIPKVVLIHGVGEGILKTALNYLLNKYNCEFYPASYKKYGLGATEVYFLQN